MFKSGFIMMIGQTNVGKSTLLNALIKHKVSIISIKKNTTRQHITGICHDKNYQLVFIDTPGISLTSEKSCCLINTDTFRNIVDMDVILLVVNYNCGNVEKKILTFIRKYKKKVILVINKIDLLRNRISIDRIILSYVKDFAFDAIIPISAVTQKNLEILKQNILSFLKTGPAYFSEDTITTISSENLISELVREKILYYLHKEIPYCCEVLVENINNNVTNIGVTEVSVVILVKKTSHKKILIGSQGNKLKQIGTDARKDINNILNMCIYLKLWVKVKKEKSS
ncbi:MAG: GTPase Era [Vigna little leaf phytoplasma]|nr:GTPase Era [Vigna little leaf phytoplasma]